LILFSLFDIPSWKPGDPEYSITFAISAILVILILGICGAKALSNPAFLRERKSQTVQDLPKAFSIASSSCEKLVGIPLKIITPFTRNSGP